MDTYPLSCIVGALLFGLKCAPRHRPNAMGFRHLGVCGGFPVLVTVGSS